MTLQGDAIFKEKLTGGLKNDLSNLLIFMLAVASLKIWTLTGLFCPKHIKSQMKKYRSVMSHDTEK